MNKRFTTLMTMLILSVFFTVSASELTTIVDGVYYKLDDNKKTAEVTYSEYFSAKCPDNIEIPSTIKFDNILYTVTSIGTGAFLDCLGLKSVSIPNSVTWISYMAFYNCSSLSSVTIPDSVTWIGEYAFYNCSSLTSANIPEAVTTIKRSTFENCSSLTSVIIPDAVTSIEITAFKNCSSLGSVNIPVAVTTIQRNAFENCSSIESIILPDAITTIEKSTFSGCSSLTSVTIPNFVTNIGESAFSGCSSLTSVTIPNSIYIIEASTFSNCSSLTSVNIPNSVTKIGSYAFSNCSNLTSVNIPNSVTMIGDFIFMNCSGIKYPIIIDHMFVFFPQSYNGYYSIPDYITNIIGGAFYGCSSLTSVNIPNSVTKIGSYAFSNCSSLTSVNIPNSVTKIGNYAFENCNIETLFFDCSENPQINDKTIKELIIGDSRISVKNYFKDMPLQKITLGKRVYIIEANAFSSSKIEEFTITGEETPDLYSNVFGVQDLSNATLYVPKSRIDYYLSTGPWLTFGKILTLSGDSPEEKKKCETPTISYSNGELVFNSLTEGVEYFSEIKSNDINKFYGSKVSLSACYDITCYAKAEGFIDSDVATAKLYWLPSSSSLEGDNINSVAMRGIAIQSAGGFINITGLDNNEKVDFFGVDGKTLGSAKSINGSVSFSAKQGTVVVAKIGKESVKIAVE